jgi:monoamine oxidase
MDRSDGKIQEDGESAAGLTRRGFLSRIGSIGGSAAVLTALESWNMGIASAQNAPPRLEGSGKGRSVVIIGAGLAGLGSAYELTRAGYECTLVEARKRSGGRVLTARRGFEMQELGGLAQKCEFDEGQYINLGPWHIPYTHRSTLHYTRELGVPIEILVTENDAAWLYFKDGKGPFAGKRLRQYAVKADIQGFTNELIVKAASSGRLDIPLSEEDRKKFISHLVREGYLDAKELKYKGIAGRRDEPGFGGAFNPEPSGNTKPMDWAGLIADNMGRFYNSVSGGTSTTPMFQMTGGMDALPRAFEKRLGPMIRFGVEVESIRQDDRGVTVNCRETATGRRSAVKADYCICTIPLSVLKNMDIQVSDPFKRAMATVTYTTVLKLGMQFGKRFWEENDHIYGGSVRTDAPTGNIQLPSEGFQSQKGVVLASYAIGTSSIKLSGMDAPGRREAALATGERIWPEDYRKYAEAAFSIAWHRTPYTMGGWANWTEAARKIAYPLLNEPDGRIYLAGEHLTHLNGWMAGALESMWQQVDKLHRRVKSS